MDYRDEYGRERRSRGQGFGRRGDYERDDDEYYGRDHERRAYGRGEDDRRRGDDRGFMERFVEELRSWFRDEDARRGRRDDRDRERGWGGAERGWGGDEDEEVDRGWARQWGYVDREPGRDRRERWSDAPRGRGGAGWRTGGEGYVAERTAGDRDDERRSGWGDPSAWGPEPGGRGAWSASGGGPHAGRGPRNYQRADDRIREDICDALCDHGYVDASDIEVVVVNGEVTLSGTVSERAQKRMAEDAVEQVSGVREVHNQLRVSQGAAGEEPPGRAGDPRFRAA
jgi:hypothetical protein